MSEIDPSGEIYLVADELRSIAELGLHYADNDYDRERYHRARSLSARLVAAIEQRAADDVLAQYEGALVHATPYVAADAAVFRDGGILLIRREDNGLWAMPGGMTEVGETWAQSAERELYEEAGVKGTATRLLGVFDSSLWGSRVRFHYYGSVWLVELDDGQTPVRRPGNDGRGVLRGGRPAGPVSRTRAPCAAGVQAGARRRAGAIFRCYGAGVGAPTVSARLRGITAQESMRKGCPQPATQTAATSPR